MEIPIETYKRGYDVGLIQGAAAERARLRRAVDELTLLMPYGESNAVVRLDDILSLLKDGDGE